MSNNTTTLKSPFHRGEIALQERAGVRDRVAEYGPRMIRDFMPDQHREFYAQLPMMVVGHADNSGRPWCSLVVGEPGFATSPHGRRLVLETQFLVGDPIVSNLQPGSQFGLLGIEFHSRRRNRMNGTVAAHEAGKLTLDVDQAFGNCPQYIQTRSHQVLPRSGEGQVSQRFDSLPADIQALIRKADTFFVASRAPLERNRRVDGIDASHRGGQPGFVRVDDSLTLTIPDYAGNNHFNTLGNFLVDPRAGLLFTNFETGDVVMLTGTVELLWDSDETAAFRGAQRLWRFRLDEGLLLPQASPLRWTFGAYSPHSLQTGTWEEAERKQTEDRNRNAWQDYEVVRVENESESIRSFYLRPSDGEPVPGYLPGQFLTIRVTPGGSELIRTYTLSSAPDDTTYRISVKREDARSSQIPGGAVSRFLHREIKVGDTISARAPQGDFVWQTDSDRPAVLISAGVGITPMVSMLRHLANSRSDAERSVTFIHAARCAEQRAFFSEVNELAAKRADKTQVFWTLSHPEPHCKAGEDFHQSGRVTGETLQRLLPLDDYDFYLCGPGGFMQGLYDQLRVLGVRDCRIHAEAFGPAALNRSTDEGIAAAPVRPEAGTAQVIFAESQVEASWVTKDGSLLETAEAEGLNPTFGCRNGACGSCVTQLVAGEVTYRTPPRATLAEDEVLLCCAVPAAPENGRPALIKLKM